MAVLLPFMCTGKTIYIKAMTGSRTFCHSLLLLLFSYLVYYCRKGENKYKNPTGFCTTMNLLGTLQFPFPRIAITLAENYNTPIPILQ
jgi:membrane-bound metal-dependent hydrolase YbcI (DUF457 family)